MNQNPKRAFALYEYKGTPSEWQEIKLSHVAKLRRIGIKVRTTTKLPPEPPRKLYIRCHHRDDGDLPLSQREKRMMKTIRFLDAQLAKYEKGDIAS